MQQPPIAKFTVKLDKAIPFKNESEKWLRISGGATLPR
jgi:hypothetical protein